MRPEVGFVAGYAMLLLAGALGLHRLGAVNSSAWTGRLLAGHRRQAADPPAATGAGAPQVDSARSSAGLATTGEEWPHVDASRLHTAVAATAAGAALLVTAAEFVRHHRPAEAALLATTGAVVATAFSRLIAALCRRGCRCPR